MESKEMIYEDLKLLTDDEWYFSIGKTDLGCEIFMILASSQKVPFFVWRGNRKSGLRMDKGDYLLHTKAEYNLKPADIKDVTEFLNKKNKYNITNFKYMLIVWNYFNKHKVSEDLKVPNYEELPEYSPTYTSVWGYFHKE